MKSIVMTAAVSAALLGCGRYDDPISLPPYGFAVRQNMAAQIVDPLPPAQQQATADAVRQRLAIARYRADVVEKPVVAATQAAVAAPAAPAAPAAAPQQ